MKKILIILSILSVSFLAYAAINQEQVTTTKATEAVQEVSQKACCATDK